MSKVKSLTVSGYKSIKELKSFELRNLNVLIGANGAGKSNFIGLFRMLNEMYEQNLATYVQVQGGPDAILHFGRSTTDRFHAEFYFDNNGYKFDLIPTNDNRLIFEREVSWFAGMLFDSQPSVNLGTGHEESKLKEAKDQYSPYVRESVSNWRVYHFHDTSETAKVKQKHERSDNLRLKSDAANLAAYLQLLKEDYSHEYLRIVETIRLVLPFFGDFIHRDQSTIELEWHQKGKPDTPFKAHMLSDGSLRFICLATLLLQPTKLLSDTILIDEPELGLHPYAITILADIFKQVSEKKQLIISTQSVELINELMPEDVIVVDQEEEASTFKRLVPEELKDWLEDYSIGDLWKQNVLGGRP
ncbi:AAA family ATPase [methanotrophic endosymbiont of Bathymodiolus puteoserpentis (Logatchev)]|jgi:predicted ATPase|uniref:AAA family ATPase n=1 Tax=methanotrophic endosymbiont of Bathymodiolus puteoserpentis (Logatchev) TaxID=343235 RepID=UPI0013CA508E|nr:AAA family ATPase [methanotrophic endosymbiont of Bathymodiolus puteoserpentis (Logatchev)]SHE22901.1 ABC transport protein, ATP-binding subunit [methanotrophic endosymbiont of Bathymodiolus puteoserpentis (Logatchev)]